jgi:hypothetical protein
MESPYGVRVKLDAGPPAEHVHRDLVRIGRAVGPRGRNRIEHVRDRDDAGPQRNLTANQAAGIPSAIEPLVMVAHDCGQLVVTQVRRHPRPVERVSFDDRELLVGEPCSLVQDLGRNVDLTHVVNRCGRANSGNLFRREAHPHRHH